MTKRIVPWNLPTIAGGSVGGYTPSSGGGGGASHFDFSGAVFSYNTTEGYVYVTVPSRNSGITTTISTLNSSAVSGIQALDYTNVAAISVTIEGTVTHPTTVTGTTTDLKLSIDPTSYGLSLVSGTVVITNSSVSGSGGLTIIVNKATFYVYNGNGEIIQTQEVAY